MRTRGGEADAKAVYLGPQLNGGDCGGGEGDRTGTTRHHRMVCDRQVLIKGSDTNDPSHSFMSSDMIVCAPTMKLRALSRKRLHQEDDGLHDCPANAMRSNDHSAQSECVFESARGKCSESWPNEQRTMKLPLSN